ncbi:hypothetical protein SCHPADRAFT_921024 [Schizopora paradoxa]|uniref:SAP domain-containing protein n=1 Tax=Schizopora paradoxa TaxID=27342 RepID=A0A0H2RNK3_9AGAM|nr:hypothetical protein SCHPADRAFT_921024 [Schizopora paradoxa]
MLRSVVQRQLSRQGSLSRCTPRRSFVSTVLLSKSYEEKTVAELRTEAKKRGLSSSGNKSTLISRILQEEQRLATSTTASTQPQNVAAPPASRRSVSSTPAVRAETLSNEVAQQTLGVRLPDLSQPPPEPPVHIPFVPDFWESSRVNAEEAKAAEAEAKENEGVPKIIVAADVSTHPLGGPSHNLYPESFGGADASAIGSSSSSSAETSGGAKREGLIADVFEDLSLPLPELSRAARASVSSITTKAGPDADSQRPLEAHERRGLWVLLGATVGAWGVSRVVSPNKSS